ncbi:hypothetical protein Pcinc_032047 [Petrolisthes cinctipes]|uniref:Carboxylesterase type B domain-containing protein n=1 Tax=Petrolisthes cinctipes TaxID=88211 RepID=A0AAE1EVB2_PETCI|nr:hypothetical protein Pcinc_032047 [Petrolisthes cinctipes]
MSFLPPFAADDFHPQTTQPLLPVIVYIHGESYEWNSGNPYDGTVLASYGQVLVVTVNFRLGVLGFLQPAFGDSHVSNFGLLDQIAALQWIKENIVNFGGDPDNVTLFGHGTGAALANLLLISPVAQVSTGLFKRAILMSGSALSNWAITKDPYKYTMQVASAVGCSSSDLGNRLANCLRQKSVKELLAVHLEAPPFTTPLGPIIDGAVLRKTPLESMTVDASVFGKYALLYGVAQSETYHILNAQEARSGFSVERRNMLIRAYVSNNFDHYSSQVYRMVINTYTPWNRSVPEDAKEVRDQALQIFCDAQISAPVLKMATLHSNINQKSFFYVFNHQSVYGDYPMSHGTVHGEDLAYIFGAPLVGGFSHFNLNYTLEEVLLSELVMTLWTNFAKTGNPNLPTPQNYRTATPSVNWEENMRTLWPPFDRQLQQYLDIDMKVLRKDHYRAHQLAVWNNLIPDLISSTRVTPFFLPPNTPSVFRFEVPPYTKPTTEIITVRPTRTVEPEIVTKPPPNAYPYHPSKSKEPEDDPTPTPPPEPPITAGSAISIVILVGIGILFINCCTMGGMYYQKDKFSHQSRILTTLGLCKAEEEGEPVSEAPSSSAMKEPTHRKRGRRSESGANNEILPEGTSRSSAGGVSRESSVKRKHQQESSGKQDTLKGSTKGSKSSKNGHKRNKSENSIYSDIERMEVAEVHSDAAGDSGRRRNHSVKFTTLGAGLPPKAVTRSTTSITSRTSVKSNTSRASIKSTTSRGSMKSTSSEKRLKKNASCQSLPTAEYSWGITPEMTMTERDDPDGRDDQKPPVDRQQTVIAMQKLNYPKVLPDRVEVGQTSTLPVSKPRPRPPPRSTSLTARDLQELEEAVHVTYRKKKISRRDASTDSGDLSAIDNIYLLEGETAPPTSMYGAPAATATVNKAHARKSDSSEYGRTGVTPDYTLSGPTRDYNRTAGALATDYGRPAAGVDYNRQGVNTIGTSYSPYEATYGYKDASVGGSHMAPTVVQEPDTMNKAYGSYGEHRTPRVPLATFGKTRNQSALEGTDHLNPRQTYEPSSPTPSPTPKPAAAVVTAAAHTALATVTAPAFVGASPSSKSTTRTAPSPAPPVAATHTTALLQQSSTTSSSDTATVYEQSENTGTIKRKKPTKNETSPTVTQTDNNKEGKAYDKPLKSALKQTSAYDKPKPVMARAPGASPPSTSASASSLSSSSTSPEVSSSGNEPARPLIHHTPSTKKSTRVATPGVRRKTKQDNHTSSTSVQANLHK